MKATATSYLYVAALLHGILRCSDGAAVEVSTQSSSCGAISSLLADLKGTCVNSPGQNGGQIEEPEKQICFSLVYNLEKLCQTGSFNASSFRQARQNKDVCRGLADVTKVEPEQCETLSEHDCRMNAKILQQISLNWKSFCPTCEKNALLCAYFIHALEAQQPNHSGTRPHDQPATTTDFKNTKQKTASDQALAKAGLDGESSEQLAIKKPTNADAEEKNHAGSPTEATPINNNSSSNNGVVEEAAAGHQEKESDDGKVDSDFPDDGLEDFDDAAFKNENVIVSSSSQQDHHPLWRQQPFFVDKLSNTRVQQEESHFLSYLVVILIAAIAAYLLFHNKQKILALMLEGRRRRTSKGRQIRRRSAQYQKLVTNMEDALSSGSGESGRHVIY